MLKTNIYFDFEDEVTNKESKLEVGDHVRISKYKSSFFQNMLFKLIRRSSAIKKFKNTVPWTYVTE